MRISSKFKMAFLTATLGITVAFSSFASFLVVNSDIQETSAWSGTQTSTEGTYYEEARGLSGSALKSSLDTIISRNVSTSYDWPRYEAADEAENESSKVLQIYTRTTIAKTAHVSGSTGWNREHSYPDSKITEPAESDNLQIFASDNKVNNTRGSKLYGIVTPKDTTTDVQDSYGNTAVNTYSNSSTFEPSDAAKGEVARATLYVNTAYGYSISGNFTSEQLCLDWAKNYPVTNREIYRNNTVYTLQGNRNPYIDHPEFIDMVYDPSYSGTGALNDTGESVEPTSLSLSPSSATIGIGGTQSLSVSALPSGASTAVTWSTSNSSIATVNNGVVTGVANGTATITATSTSNTSIKATMSVTVTPPVPPTSISVSPVNLSLPLGSTSPLSVSSSPSGSNKSVTWSTSNAAVAIVSNGVVSGLALGNATITATSSVNPSLTATCQVTVTQPQAETSISYNFTSKSWGGSPANWHSGKEGNGYLNNGVQVSTGASGAYGNSPTSFDNIKKVTVQYCTNGSSGAGKITVSAVNSSTSSAKSGTQIASLSVTSSGGTTPRNLEFVYESNGLNGHIQILVETTINSIYITGVTITYGSDAPIINPSEEAETWAVDFLNQTSLGCQNKNSLQLASVWNDLKTNYIAMSDASKMIFTTATPDALGSNIENAVARYIDIVSKYGLEAFIDDVETANNSYPALIIKEENMAFLLIFLAIVFLAGMMIFALTRKNKHR